MKNITLLILSFLWISPHLSGQIPLEESDPRYQKTSGIYDNLLRHTYLKKEAPKLIMYEGKYDGAFIKYSSLRDTIYMDTYLYDLCLEQDPYGGLIAFVLGHELGHPAYDENTHLTITVVADYLGVNKLNAREVYSDVYGAMLCKFAKYFLDIKVNDFFERFYEAYHDRFDTLKISRQLHDRRYPDSRAEAEIDRYTALYEAASLATVFHQYEFAQRCLAEFQYTFQETPTLQNNLGAILVLEALYNKRKRFPSEKIPLFPIEINMSPFPLKPQRKLEDKSDILLQQALTHFETSINLLPTYYSAYINRACAYTLLKNYPKALENIQTVEHSPSANEQEKRDACWLRSIIYELQNNFKLSDSLKEKCMPQYLNGIEISNLGKEYTEGSWDHDADDFDIPQNLWIAYSSRIKPHGPILDYVQINDTNYYKIHLTNRNEDKTETIKIKWEPHVEILDIIAVKNSGYLRFNYTGTHPPYTLYRSNQFFLVNTQEGIAYLCYTVGDEIHTQRKCTINN